MALSGHPTPLGATSPHTEHESEAHALNENSIPDQAAIMAALSAAEHIVAESPVKIDDISICCGSIQIHFYDRPDATAEFAVAFDLQLALRPHRGTMRPLLETRGTVNGFEVRAWSLGNDSEQERYAACLPESAAGSLPVAWRASAGAA